MKKITLSLSLIIILLLNSCIFSDEVTVDQISDTEPIPDTTNELLSGNWKLITEGEESLTFHTTVENPSSGELLSTYLVIPEINTKDPIPTVFLIPGGSDYGTNAFNQGDTTSEFLTENNIAYAYFDPDGRGESEGEEDANGHIHQDGLFAATQAVIKHLAVDEDEIGIISYSYGTTLASGMLSRYADESPYKWYIDWEGPSKREYTTTGCNTENVKVKAVAVSCEDDDFWSERESATFLSTITIPYLRAQKDKDHVQENNNHAIDSINAATEGLSPWTRLNEKEINQTYTYETQIIYPVKVDAVDYALEMFELF